MKKGIKLLALGCALALSSGVALAQEGWYVFGTSGVAHTKLDTSNTEHATVITGDNTDKLGVDLGVGYRMNKYWGLETSYVHFGTPDYDLLRTTTGEVSNMKVKNQGLVLAVQGYYPLNVATTLTAKAGVVYVSTKLDREGLPGNTDTYHVSDHQTTGTVGIGALYKLNAHWDVRSNLDWYPKLTKTNDNATDTKAYMFSVGAQYNF